MLAQTRSADLLTLQTEVLESVAIGEPLLSTADLICRRAESLAPTAHCSMLLIDGSGRLRPLASPSLPAYYNAALDGVQIGPGVGSCGTAAFQGGAVVVTDIAVDPLWTDFRALALPLGLRACWSIPIWSRDGRVAGTFALYFKSPRGPDELERRIVETCVHLAAIAVQHHEVQARNDLLARSDALTHLPNRRSFDRLLSERTGSERGSFALLMMDIDRLKTVNDTMGHAAGDALIRHVASKLSQIAGHHVVCRIGGDEFAALLYDCPTPQAMRTRAHRFIQAARSRLVWNGQSMLPRLTVGGALFGPDGTDAETLRQNADFALYRAKETRRGDYARFHEDLRRTVTQRSKAINAVSEALHAGRVVPYFQPIVRLESAEIVGLEALARMRMPDGRVVSAGEFQPALADPAVGYQLTTLMMGEVALAVRKWLDEGIPFQHVGINVSGCDFARGDVGGRLTRAFARAGVPLEHVVLEVTESVLMDGSDTTVAKAVSHLRSKGLLVALDDFGTGFASLTHLLSLPVDIIKIDRSFIDRLLSDRNSAVIVEALIDIARKLKMRVVAEGIETAEQADRLRALDCRLGQGYHFAPPVDFETTTHLLRTFAQGVPQPLTLARPTAAAG